LPLVAQQVKAQQAPRRPTPERIRYLDPGTEQEVTRLTDPKAFACMLPPAQHIVFSRRQNVMLYLSDRGGKMQAWTMDLKSYASRPWTQAEAIIPSSATFAFDERSVVYIDGDGLWLQPGGGLKARRVHRFEGRPGEGVGVTPEGMAAVVEGDKLRLVHMVRGTVATIVESAEGPSQPMPRPKRASVLYHAGGGLWLAHMDGQRNFRLKTAPGLVGQARWSPDGRTVLYLHSPEEGKPSGLREVDPDTGEDTAISGTSNYATFCANGDATVFAGASASKAGPYVLLLVRKARRERALCEHKATQPMSVSPVFSPDSQRLFFASDQHGKSALYMVETQRLVEKTET
jgi:oligogalacturonide lyase